MTETSKDSNGFIIDSMCGKLARWLRFLGIDSLYAQDASAAAIERLALKSGRTIVTRSHKFDNHKGIKTIVLKAEDMERQIQELARHGALGHRSSELGRCSICNEPLKPVEKKRIKDLVPPFVYDTHELFLECSSCRKIYWQGTHFTHIKKRIEKLLALLMVCALLAPGCTKKVLYHTTERGVPIARILVADEQDLVTISCSSMLTITSGAKRLRLNPYDTVSISMGSPYAFPLELSAPNNVPISVNNIEYPGKIRIMNEPNLRVVNEVDLETYLKGVVPHEIGSRPPEEIEVIKAQAVAARTYAIKHLDLSERPLYDLVATVFDQVYKGMLYRNPLADSAINATYGEIITYRGKPIEAKYSSTCGGITSDTRDNWGDEPVPYLQSVPDNAESGAQNAFCSISPLFTWKERYAKEDFYRMLRINIYGDAEDSLLTPPTVTGFRLGRNPKSKRVTLLEVTVDSDTFAFKGLDIRKVLKPGDKLLWSNYFTIDITEDSILIDGKGAGHGCGMCQWGAIGMARKGYRYDEILRHYYRGTHVTKVY
jgi:SpoIID/LytB domain protein